MDDFDMDDDDMDDFDMDDIYVFSGNTDELMNHLSNLKKNLTISEEGTIMFHGYDEADFGSKDEVDTFPEGLTQANTLLQKFML